MRAGPAWPGNGGGIFSPPPEFGNGAATVLASDAAATKRETSLFNLLFSFFNFSNSARIFLSTLLASFSFDTSATFDSSFVFVSGVSFAFAEARSSFSSLFIRARCLETTSSMSLNCW